MSLCYSSIPSSLTDLATFACISQNMCSLMTLLKALTKGSTMKVGEGPLFPECSYSLGRCQAAAHWEPSTGDTSEDLHMHKSVMSRICMVSMEQGRELFKVISLPHFITPPHSIQSQPHSPPLSFTTLFHYILPPHATFACISQNMCSLITLLKALEKSN